MIKVLLSTLFAIALFSTVEGHEYHVSITEINLNEQTNRLEISMQLFMDDFEKALRSANKNVKIKDDLSEEAVWTVIQWYLEEHFSVTVNGSRLMFRYIGAEWDKDLHSFHVHSESEEIDEISEVSIYNSIFTEISPEQENMHHLNIGSTHESMLLVKDKERGSIIITP